MVDVLMSFFRQLSAAQREVNHYEKRIDVVTIDPCSAEVWAIEAKTSAWSRALGQAIVNLSAAHRSYIAIYERYVHRVPVDVLLQHGVGLISVGTKWGEVEVLLKAPKSPYSNPVVIDRMRNRLTPQESA